MWKNYFVFGLRHFSKNKTNLLISFFGLSVAILAVLLIGIYVVSNLEHDTNQTKSERIYRLEENDWALMGLKHGELLGDNTKEVETYVRVAPSYCNTDMKGDLGNYSTDHLSFVDTSIFKVFDFNMVYGDPKTALINKNSIVLSLSAARQLFGDTDPIGKTVRSMSMVINKEFVVSAVYRDMPLFHLQLDALVNMEAYIEARGRYANANKLAGYNEAIYFLMKQPLAEKDRVVKSMVDFLANHPLNKEGKEYAYLNLRPMDDIYFGFNGAYEHGSTRHSRKDILYVLVGIGFLILLIACVNFVNLNIAKASLRYKEVGMRKVLGATASDVYYMMFVEVVLVATIAVALGWLLTYYLIPVINQALGINLLFSFNTSLLLISFGVVLLVSLLAGLPSASSLSAINPILSLAGGKLKEKGGMALKNALLGFQVFVSASLIAGTLVLMGQFNYMKNKDLGFNKDNIIVVRMNREVLGNIKAFSNDIEAIPGVIETARANNLISNIGWTETRKSKDGTDVSCKFWPVTTNFHNVFDLELKSGRFFDAQDDKKSLLINETALKAFGYDEEEILTQSLYKDYKCVGVVKDFRFNSLHNAISPLVIPAISNYCPIYYLRLNGTDNKASFKRLREVWNTYSPDSPFNPILLEQYIEDNYMAEKTLGTTFSSFTMIAIVLVVLGMLGVVRFILGRRTRDIAIRSVLGADKKSLVWELSKPTITLITVVSILSVPLIYVFMERWLAGFNEHIMFPYIVFLIAFVFHLGVASSMIYFHINRILKRELMKAIRTE